jgi:hypothetical protein
MAVVANNPAGDVEKERIEAYSAGATASPQIPEGRAVTYQVILRHLAKFRDGASALMELFAAHVPVAETAQAPPTESGASAPAVSSAAEHQQKSLLELRIERHMYKVEQSLRQIQSLNPERKKRLDLPPQVRGQILTKEWTIHDIVGAELHFWSAAIENSPLGKFDQTEQAWVRWIIRLANNIGVDAEHQEHLDFLKDWASHEHA